MSRISRADESLFARWWWSVDRPSLAILGMIILAGCVLVLAAGPAAAARLRIQSEFYFAIKQFLFLAPAIVAMVAISMMTPLQARRLGVLVFVGGVVMMIVTLIIGGDVKGARRWIDFGPMSLQASEFAKSGFIVTAAWMLAEGARDPRFPGAAVAMGLYIVFAGLLLMQPDFGQWFLVTAVWGMMFFIAGMSWAWMIALGVGGVAALAAGYAFFPHVAARIDGFLNPEAGESYQVDRALETIANGGLIGRGDAPPVKMHLPDPHTDFIFAVAGEEFGFALCALIIALYAAFVIRSLLLAAGLKSLFSQCAASGLAAMIGFQAMINIGVSLRALPAKGMTLPFISYGGSSLLATGLAVGLIIALTRKPQGVWRRKDIMP